MRVVDKPTAMTAATTTTTTVAASSLTFVSFPGEDDWCKGEGGGGGYSSLNQLSSAGLPDDVVSDGVEEVSAPEGRCSSLADEMAGDGQRADKYILQIPYTVLSSIVQSLDADKGWESLAAAANYTFENIRLLELESMRLHGSPTKSLMLELGSRNTTVRQLYDRLNEIRRYREMKILEDYVNGVVPPQASAMSSGLKGLKSQDPPDSNKGMPSGKKEGSNFGSMSSICSDEVNFNQPKSSNDANASMDLQKVKQYSGKQIPGGSKIATTSSSVLNTTQQQSSGRQIQNYIKPPAVIPGKNGSTAVPCLKNVPAQASSSQCISSLGSPFSSSSVSLPSSAGSLSSSKVINMESIIDSSAYSYSEVVAATNNFNEENKIGEGAFGTVYFGILRHLQCAVKRMSEANTAETTVERSSQVMREMTCLLKFRHENLVTLYGYALDGPSLCLIYQYMPNGSLEDRLMCKNKTAPLNWAQRLNIMTGASRGLHFLHTMREQPLIHGDIKSANILLDKNFEARIGDLGQAEQATGCEKGSSSQRHTHITRAQVTSKLYGTKAYQPREVLAGGSLSIKGDVFAMGVVLLEVYSGEQAYDNRREGGPFLAEYFHNKVEEADQKESELLTCLDSRAGECPQEVALKMLHLIMRSIDNLKRVRPDSTEFLKEITAVENLYRQKCGLGSTGSESLPGSVRSCHVSHTSSPHSIGNLAGAPSPQDQQPNTQPSSLCQASRDQEPVVDNRLAATSLVLTSKYEAHLDNRLVANMDNSALNFHDKHMTMLSRKENRSVCNQDEDGSLYNQEDSISATPGVSPIELFPRNQPLPPAFRLQQEYDKQQSAADKRRISRLSNCPDTREPDGKQNENIPEADPAKLAELERFDRINLGQGQVEGDLQCDPKKLAALKQFDQRQEIADPSSVSQHKQTSSDDVILECDPKKVAYLKDFDQHNMQERLSPGPDRVMASDPKKAGLPHAGWWRQ